MKGSLQSRVHLGLVKGFSLIDSNNLLFIPHVQRERGICDRGWCPFICMFIYVYMYVTPQKV